MARRCPSLPQTGRAPASSCNNTRCCGRRHRRRWPPRPPGVQIDGRRWGPPESGCRPSRQGWLCSCPLYRPRPFTPDCQPWQIQNCAAKLREWSFQACLHSIGGRALHPGAQGLRYRGGRRARRLDPLCLVIAAMVGSIHLGILYVFPIAVCSRVATTTCNWVEGFAPQTCT